MKQTPQGTPGPDDLLEAQRRAHRDQPRSVKDDAVDGKRLQVEPDGTGPTPTESFDPEEDRHAGSGNGAPMPTADAPPARSPR